MLLFDCRCRSWDAELLFLLVHCGRDIMISENTRLNEKRETNSQHLTDDAAQSDHTRGFHCSFAFTLSCNRVKPVENKARSVLCTQLWCPLSTSYYAGGAFPLWFASHLPPALTVTPPLHLHRFELSGTSANWFKYASALLQIEMTGRTPCPKKLHGPWKGFWQTTP